MATNKIAQDIQVVQNDLFINPKTGDFVITPSDSQHVLDILESEQGWWKQFPAIGAAFRRLLKAKVSVPIVQSLMKQQLESDGYQVANPQVSIDSGGNATIAPNAKRVRF